MRLVKLGVKTRLRKTKYQINSSLQKLFSKRMHIINQSVKIYKMIHTQQEVRNSRGKMNRTISTGVTGVTHLTIIPKTYWKLNSQKNSEPENESSEFWRKSIERMRRADLDRRGPELVPANPELTLAGLRMAIGVFLMLYFS